MLGLFSLQQTQTPETFAAVDLGSNSFHMIVAQVKDGQIQVLDKLREMVRLASGLDEQKNLSAEIQARAIACLERFGQRLRDMPPGSVRVVGTNTLRTAHNSREFIRAAETALGHPIEIIAGREEARLIYLGVAHSLAHNDEEKRLVMDIGGGSTEFIIGKHFDTLRRESLYMGCVTMSRRFFPDGEYTAKAMRKAEIAARLELQPITRPYKDIGWEQAVGASGSIKAIDKIVRAQGWSEHGITLDALHQLREALLSAGHADKLKLEGLAEERIPVLPGGLAVLLGSFEELGIQRMTVSEGALREGLIFDLLGRIHQEDIRERTIQRFQERYKIDVAQAQDVEQTSLALLEQVSQACALCSGEHQHVLSWAARLHEIGLIIAHNQYHKHGAYILTASDLAGFSRQEQTLLAALVRGHRRKFPLDVFNGFMDEAERNMAIRLCFILRLAVLLHRGRSHQAIPPLRLEIQQQSHFKLYFPEGWLEQNPLTLADLENEQAYLTATSIAFDFE